MSHQTQSNTLPLKADLARAVVRLLRRLDVAEQAAYGQPQDSAERDAAVKAIGRYQGSAMADAGRSRK